MCACERSGREPWCEALVAEARAEARQLRYWTHLRSANALLNMGEAVAELLDRLADALAESANSQSVPRP